MCVNLKECHLDIQEFCFVMNNYRINKTTNFKNIFTKRQNYFKSVTISYVRISIISVEPTV